MRVLFIDSHKKYLEMMYKYLTWHGIEVEPFVSSAQAVEELEKRDFDLLVCDAFTVPIDGFSLAKSIRKHPSDQVKNTSVLVVSDEEIDLNDMVFLRRNSIYYMSKYKSVEKWKEKIFTILSQEVSV